VSVVMIGTLAAVGTLRPSKLMFVRRNELMLIEGEPRLSLRDGLVCPSDDQL